MKIQNNVLGVKTVSWDEISEYDLNDLKVAQGRDLTKIKNSIINRGFNFPVAIWADHRYVIDGAGRLSALKELAAEGYTMDKIPVFQVKATSYEQAKALVLQASSQHGEVTKDSYEQFCADLAMAEYGDELAIFMQGESLTAMLDAIEEAQQLEPEGDPDAEVEPPKEPISVEGDLYEIGENRHRLLCGDSTQYHDVQKLMDGTMADMVLTDPPYNVAYDNQKYYGEGKSSKSKLDPIENDDMDDGAFYDFLLQVYTNLLTVTKPGGAIYVFFAIMESKNFFGALKDSGFLLKQCLIWVKNNFVLGRQDYQWKHEPILYGWAPGEANNWYSDRKQTTVLEFDLPQRNGEHPTMKPVEILQYLLGNSSKPGDTVIDLFGGSGSTMVACEMEGRKAYLCEKDPRYVDVIVARMKKLFPHLRIKRNGVDFQ